MRYVYFRFNFFLWTAGRGVWISDRCYYHMGHNHNTQWIGHSCLIINNIENG